jgi:predicted molibdopterin-dependent oxidoreductase YjgC
VEEQITNGRWQIANVAEKRTQLPAPSPQPSISADTFIQTDWDTALDVVARKLVEVKQTHGGDALALLASAKCTNEENYLFSKFTRQVLGTNNIDHCARL